MGDGSMAYKGRISDFLTEFREVASASGTCVAPIRIECAQLSDVIADGNRIRC
jgi:hypothetical protein